MEVESQFVVRLNKDDVIRAKGDGVVVKLPALTDNILVVILNGNGAKGGGGE